MHNNNKTNNSNNDDSATEAELRRAAQLRQAARDDPAIDDALVTDWEWLQHAIASMRVMGIPSRKLAMQRASARW